jgi:hypothetical protein
MIVINFYFSNTEKWIEYEKEGIVEKKYFDSVQSLEYFIAENDLSLTYQGCVNC